MSCSTVRNSRPYVIPAVSDPRPSLQARCAAGRDSAALAARDMLCAAANDLIIGTFVLAPAMVGGNCFDSPTVAAEVTLGERLEAARNSLLYLGRGVMAALSTPFMCLGAAAYGASIGLAVRPTMLRWKSDDLPYG